MSKKPIHFILLLWALTSGAALAYETETHEEIVDHAYRASVLSEDFVWDALRINPDEPLEVFDFKITEFTKERLEETEFEGATPLAIIRTGATLEDEIFDEDRVIRILNHFFDPFNDRALTIGESILARDSSPDWSVEEIEISRQRRSYTDAQDLYYEILTEPFSLRRAEFFRNLGQVLHHIADMAQPDHVRNDQHLAFGIGLIDDNSGFTDPSLYERYTRLLTIEIDPENPDNDGVNEFPDSVLQPEFLNTLNGYAPVQLMTPRDYWHTEGAQNYNGVGLAEFTNREFVSNDTNFGSPGSADFPRPNLEEDANLNGSVNDGFTDAVGVYNRFNLTIPELCNSPPVIGLSSCFMRFRAMAVDDNLRPQGNPLINKYAVTESIFNQDVTDINFRGLAGRAPSGLYTLNTINFWSGYPLLLSRASGYTSGLINHFFRGRLEVGAPEDGIIALTDQTDMGTNSIEDDLTGFTKLKLTVKNMTESIPIPGGFGDEEAQDLGAGTLVAVVRAHLNSCFRQDLSGEIQGFVRSDPELEWFLSQGRILEVRSAREPSTNQPQSTFFRKRFRPKFSVQETATRPFVTANNETIGQCRDLRPVSITSQEIQISAGEITSDQSKEFVFDFSNNVIPLSASYDLGSL